MNTRGEAWVMFLIDVVISSAAEAVDEVDDTRGFGVVAPSPYQISPKKTPGKRPSLAQSEIL